MGNNLGACICLPSWTKTAIALQHFKSSVPHGKGLLQLTHGNLILSKHAIIRIYPEVWFAGEILCLHVSICYSLTFWACRQTDMNDYHTKANRNSSYPDKYVRHGNVYSIFKLPIGLWHICFKQSFLDTLGFFLVSSVYCLMTQISSYPSVTSYQIMNSPCLPSLLRDFFPLVLGICQINSKWMQFISIALITAWQVRKRMDIYNWFLQGLNLLCKIT